MKFTLSWLKDHLETEASPEELATKLSAIGLEVEGIEDPGKDLGVFTIARVLEAKQHPNADRLRVCQVEIAPGQPPVEVVCGAPNARTGMVAVFAPLGSYIPGTGITLDKRPVRGVVSNGMLVSERELQLSDDHEGIIDLSADLAGRVGDRYVDVLGLTDPVFEVKLTPNRPDCTGVRGIARDLAAAGLGTLKPEPKLAHKVEGDFDCPIDIRLDFPAGAESACPVFAGRFVRNVKNGPAPDWMQRRLKAVGLRPISALVDITNYISLDRGRPLHVYDADKVKGAIRARLGRAGESFEGLDGKKHAIDETMCVIADESGPLGFGGILGGVSTGCSETTRNVLIECAYFDPLRTAATGRKAGVQTDARYRFERGVDPAFVVPGVDLATEMVLALCGGEPSRRRVAGEPPISRRVVTFDLGRIEKLGGLAIDQKEARRILESLGFTVAGKGATVEVTIPTWRPDVHGSADLVEEVVRIVGLDKVPPAPLPRTHGVTRAVLTEGQKRARRARRLLAGRGLVEAITWSFIPRGEATVFGGGSDALELANPISVEMSSMRPSLLPGLLKAVQRNRDRGFADVGLFELGQAYRGDKETDQLLVAAGVRAGATRLAGSGRHWSGGIADADVFDVKADVAATLAALGFDATPSHVDLAARGIDVDAEEPAAGKLLLVLQGRDDLRHDRLERADREPRRLAENLRERLVERELDDVLGRRGDREVGQHLATAVVDAVEADARRGEHVLDGGKVVLAPVGEAEDLGAVASGEGEREGRHRNAGRVGRSEVVDLHVEDRAARGRVACDLGADEEVERRPALVEGDELLDALLKLREERRDRGALDSVERRDERQRPELHAAGGILLVEHRDALDVLEADLHAGLLEPDHAPLAGQPVAEVLDARRGGGPGIRRKERVGAIGERLDDAPVDAVEGRVETLGRDLERRGIGGDHGGAGAEPGQLHRREDARVVIEVTRRESLAVCAQRGLERREVGARILELRQAHRPRVADADLVDAEHVGKRGGAHQEGRGERGGESEPKERRRSERAHEASRRAGRRPERVFEDESGLLSGSVECIPRSEIPAVLARAAHVCPPRSPLAGATDRACVGYRHCRLSAEDRKWL